MYETSARLLRLLSLLQSRRDWTGAELADRLEVSGRTVRNDIERLRRLGYPVHAGRGSAGGYRLGAGATLPPLLLDDEEAVAVVVGLRAAATGRGRGAWPASRRRPCAAWPRWSRCCRPPCVARSARSRRTPWPCRPTPRHRPWTRRC